MVREAFFQAHPSNTTRWRVRGLALVLSLGSALGCSDDALDTSEGDAGANESDAGATDASVTDTSDAGADDSVERSRIARAPIPLTLGEELGATLSPRTPSWLFTFELTGPASVKLRTQAATGGPTVDTVLTLSRLNQNGLPRLLGTSDDFGKTTWSGLDRNLDTGVYRVLVRGATLLSRGPFTLTSTCTGTGCPPPPSTCLFGEVFSDLRDNPRLNIVSEEWIGSVAQLGSVVQQDQLVLAVRQSSFTDVKTPADALAVVDEQKVRRLELQERDGTRSYSVYEYGAGDNSYGAIFVGGSVELAASIHDGDLLACTARP